MSKCVSTPTNELTLSLVLRGPASKKKTKSQKSYCQRQIQHVRRKGWEGLIERLTKHLCHPEF